MEPQVGHKSSIIRTIKLSQCKSFLGSTTDEFLKISHFILIVVTYPRSQQKTHTFGSLIACQLVTPLMYISKCRGTDLFKTALCKHVYSMPHAVEYAVPSDLENLHLEHNDFCRKWPLPETRLSLPITYLLDLAGAFECMRPLAASCWDCLVNHTLCFERFYRPFVGGSEESINSAATYLMYGRANWLKVLDWCKEI